MQDDGRTIGIVALIASLAGAVLFALVLADLWRFSASGGALLASGALGLVGALAGWSARKSLAAGLARFAMRLGLATALAAVLTVGFLTPASVETSGPVEVRPA